MRFGKMILNASKNKTMRQHDGKTGEQMTRMCSYEGDKAGQLAKVCIYLWGCSKWRGNDLRAI